MHVHAFSAVAVMQMKRFAQSVSVLYLHLLVKYDHYFSGVRLLPYPSAKTKLRVFFVVVRFLFCA